MQNASLGTIKAFKALVMQELLRRRCFEPHAHALERTRVPVVPTRYLLTQYQEAMVLQVLSLQAARFMMQAELRSAPQSMPI